MLRLSALLFAALGVLCAQSPSSRSYNGRPAVALANDRVEVLILPQGATIASIILKDDPAGLNPLWNPGEKSGAIGIGHFLCLDGFGQTSPQEQKAGLPFHGEAMRAAFKRESGDAASVTFSARLPLVQERVTRTYRLRPGENVLYVRTRVESEVAFDRPMVWAEHGTIGSPFLKRGVTAMDIGGTRSQTRVWKDRGRGPVQRRLASGREFQWPAAPTLDGAAVDLRTAPQQPGSGDHTTTLIDPSRTYGFATALHPGKRLLVGWIWRRADFPWLQNWEHYPAEGVLARGLEFATQPFDIPRREAVALAGMFDAPVFRWLPAKSVIEADFILFYTRVPEGFARVKDVRVSDGTIVLDDGTGNSVELAVSLPL